MYMQYADTDTCTCMMHAACTNRMTVNVNVYGTVFKTYFAFVISISGHMVIFLYQ